MTAQERDGVLPIQQLRHAIRAGEIASDREIETWQHQPNSLDLRLGATGYKTRCSFLPTTRSVDDYLREFKLTDFSLRDGYVLDRDNIYLVELQERLSLPPGIRARANPKSTTGRLDILARVLTEGARSFEDVAEGYTGKLWVEIVPKSFPILAREGDALVQLRLIRGANPPLSDDTLREYLLGGKLLRRTPGRPLAGDISVSDGLVLTVGLSSGRRGGTIGYRARRTTPVVDLRRRTHSVAQYWEPLQEDSYRALILERQDFYILRSREFISVPPELCAEMVPYDSESGELRTHYAGFFDSGFGCTDAGARAILEVRNHDVAFLLQEGQRVFRLRYYRNSAIPEVLYGSTGSSYQDQDLKLPKQFTSTRDSHSTPSPFQSLFGPPE